MKNEVEKNEGKSLLKGKDLEKASGGYIYNAEYKPTHQYEVINDITGKVMLRCECLEEARQAANYLGQRPNQIDGDTLYRIIHEDNTRDKIGIDPPPHTEE